MTTDLRATEIQLQLIGGHVDKALAAACVGLKECLFSESKFLASDSVWDAKTASDAATKLLPNGVEIDKYASALERALNEFGYNAVTASQVSSELRAALHEIKQEGVSSDAFPKSLTRALELQKVICSLPPELDDRLKAEENRSNLVRGTVKVGVALAAAGAVGILAAPASVPLLAAAASWPAISAMLNLALGHVFGKSVDSAYAEFTSLTDAKPKKCGCHCEDTKRMPAPAP